MTPGQIKSAEILLAKSVPNLQQVDVQQQLNMDIVGVRMWTRDEWLASRTALRKQFEPFHERAERYAVAVSHRRAGKTLAAVCDMVWRAASKPGGHYAFIAPYYHQAKMAAWEYVKQSQVCGEQLYVLRSQIEKDGQLASRTGQDQYTAGVEIEDEGLNC